MVKVQGSLICRLVVAKSLLMKRWYTSRYHASSKDALFRALGFLFGCRVLCNNLQACSWESGVFRVWCEKPLMEEVWNTM